MLACQALFLFYIAMTENELFFATIQSGNEDNIKAQLTRNPDLVNIKDQRGFTPLIFATYFNKENIAEILLEHYVDVNGKDASGNTALIGVSFKGNTAIAEKLLQHNADRKSVV